MSVEPLPPLQPPGMEPIFVRVVQAGTRKLLCPKFETFVIEGVQQFRSRVAYLLNDGKLVQPFNGDIDRVTDLKLSMKVKGTMVVMEDSKNKDQSDLTYVGEYIDEVTRADLVDSPEKRKRPIIIAANDAAKTLIGDSSDEEDEDDTDAGAGGAAGGGVGGAGGGVGAAGAGSTESADVAASESTASVVDIGDSNSSGSGGGGGGSKSSPEKNKGQPNVIYTVFVAGEGKQRESFVQNT
ncbi:hypothetical protein OAM67_00395 [bacterium]|nr:hypothetical protein [bacterium]